jgi:hypothetical protein
MCYIDGQKNKYSVLNECNRMLKYNILKNLIYLIRSRNRDLPACNMVPQLLRYRVH